MGYITSQSLSSLIGIRHGFFTRGHGIENGNGETDTWGNSQGIYGRLNCGLSSLDNTDTVVQNRSLLAKRGFGQEASQLLTVCQIHSGIVHTVTSPWPENHIPDGDGLVTNTPNLILGILTADCAPILFTDTAQSIVGACHAGWRGASGIGIGKAANTGSVIDNTVAAMRRLGATNIIAAVGPCIQKQSYEISSDFKAAFLEIDSSNDRFFNDGDKPDHPHFDLSGYCAHRLQSIGVTTIDRLPHDTLTEENRLFSYRRSQLRSEGDYGRQMSAIMIRAFPI